jgi:ParB-like chromosome segregation protein Spo0J
MRIGNVPSFDGRVIDRHVSLLRPNPRNARTHGKAQIRALSESIKSFGFTTPILVDEQNCVLAGH